MTSTENKKQPALPCMPIQDNLGRIVAPIPGLNKEEYVFLNVLCSLITTNTDNKIGIRGEKTEDIKNAKKYTELHFEHFERIEKQNTDIHIIK